MDSIVSRVKVALRITSEEFDEYISMLASAALDDLVACGVSAEALGNDGRGPMPPLVENAVACYVAAHFDRDATEDAKRFAEAYSRLAIRLSMDSRYGAGHEV